MFKTAFPPGWIGKHKIISQGFREQIWIETRKDLALCRKEFSIRENSLINFLHSKGNWQSELIRFGFNYTLINSMVNKNFLVKTKKMKMFNTQLNSFQNDLNEIKKPVLTKEQKNAYLEMKAMKPGESLLLWGETGSGKTEVYMRITEDQILSKKSCLILAPEIGLIPQLVDRFSNRFRNIVFEYHSNCSSKHRTLVWKKILNANEP